MNDIVSYFICYIACMSRHWCVFSMSLKPDNILEKGMKCVGKTWRRWKSSDSLDREETEYDIEDDLVT